MLWKNQKGDLPRIFEKSFTGKNGHNLQYSTGMGLYLCKKIFLNPIILFWYFATNIIKYLFHIIINSFYDSLQEITKAMNDEIESHIRLNEEFKQYINTWVHENPLHILLHYL